MNWGIVGVMQSNLESQSTLDSQCDSERQPAPAVPGFSVRRLLGIGGQAAVWLVRAERRRPGLPEELALKVPRRSSAGDAASQAEPADIRAELQAMEPLRHPHIVRAYGAVPTSVGPGLLLDAYTGGALSGLIRAEGRIGPGELVTAMSPIAEAVAHLQSQGAVHGDISAGNVLLAPDGRPALADLGEAQLLGTPLSERGTPGFMAPEREDLIRGHDAGRSLSRRLASDLASEADVYSLAAVCWYALTGEAPVTGRDRPPLSALCSEAPEPLVGLLEEGLSEHPEGRPTAAEFAHDLFCAAPAQPLDLSAHVEDEVLPELPTRLPDPRDRPRAPLGRMLRSRVGVIAAACALVLGTGGWLWWSGLESSAVQGHGEMVQSARDGISEAEVLEALERLTAADPEQALEGIAALRTAALSEPGSDLAQVYTVEGSPALSADRELMDSLLAEEISYVGQQMEMEILDADPVSSAPVGEGELSEPDDGLESDEEAALDVRVSAQDFHSEQLHTQEVRLILQRHGDRWLLYEVREL